MEKCKPGYALVVEKWQQDCRQAEEQGKPASYLPDAPIGPESQHSPSGLYNAMISPLTKFSVAGFLWYQGESNCDRAAQYEVLFPEMIRDWRNAWGRGDIAFLYVQLANFDQPWWPKGCWPELREAQIAGLTEPNTAMICAIDIGESNDIHPKDKQTVAARLANAALAKVYHRQTAYLCPTYSSLRVDADTIIVHFRDVQGKLISKGAIIGFEVAGEDRKFYPARAVLDVNSVRLFSPDVARPVAVRYLWADDPKVSLFDSNSGLPLAPFRTDKWPRITEGVLYSPIYYQFRYLPDE